MRIFGMPAELFSSTVLNDFEPVNQQIYRLLRQAIVNCTLKPGAQLSEKDVAEHLGVSRQPVREAFIKLSETNLIKVLPQRGTFVLKISSKQVHDSRFIREAIEIAVIKRAAELLKGEDFVRLRQNLDAQAEAAKRDDPVDFLRLDDAFHCMLAEMIDCTSAWDIIENLKAHMDRVRYLTLGQLSPLTHLVEQHNKIYTALQTGDPAQAESAMHSHLSELNSTLHQVSTLYPDWFE